MSSLEISPIDQSIHLDVRAQAIDLLILEMVSNSGMVRRHNTSIGSIALSSG